MESTRVCSIRALPALWDAFDACCKDVGSNRNEVMRALMQDFVDDHREAPTHTEARMPNGSTAHPAHR